MMLMTVSSSYCTLSVIRRRVIKKFNIISKRASLSYIRESSYCVIVIPTGDVFNGSDTVILKALRSTALGLNRSFDF